jgi:hypothetical protein
MAESLWKELREDFFEELNFEEVTDPSGKGEPRIRVTAVVQEADTVNKNKRIYPRETLDDAVQALMPLIKEKRVFCEVDHPEFKGKLKETSHLVTDLKWNPLKGKENQLMADLLVLNTPPGLVLKEILRAGGRPGLSSRGKGKSAPLTMPGVGEVEKIEKGYRFNAFDVVIDPSVLTAQIKQYIESSEGQNSETEVKTMNLEELKKNHPDLVEALKKELREEVKTDLDAEFQKQLTEQKTRVTELETELNEKDAEIERHLTTINAIAEILTTGEYLKPAGDQTAEDTDKLAMREKIDELEDKLTVVNTSLKEKEDKVKKIEDERNEEAVLTYLTEKTSDFQFGALMKTKILEQKPKTKAEVDEAVKSYKEFVETLQKDLGPGGLKGKSRGKTFIEGAGEEEVKKLHSRVQALGGVKLKREEKR